MKASNASPEGQGNGSVTFSGVGARAKTLMRTDIQALRGLAVLMVVFYHVKIGSIDAGYLGVDVFFVISGYLITSLVAGGIERGDFRLADFYFRRAKRLLPAAYVTFLVTALLAPWFLNQLELRDFALQVIGAISFTANVFLWQQTDYFNGASDLKPLLHVWSLSLEEQYYMLLPAALLFLRRPLWLRAVIVALVFSLGICFVGGMTKPVATFYLLPTRAWELLIGSAGALLTGQYGSRRISNVRIVRALFYPSLVALLVLPIYPIGSKHPGLGAFLICMATLVVIARNHERLEGSSVAKGLARVGDLSYSLYLVHWPVIALLKNAWVGADGELPMYLKLIELVLAFAFAYPLHRFVEYPIHQSRLRYVPSLLLKTGLVSVVLISIAPVAIRATKVSIDFVEIRKINYGFGEDCEYTTLFSPKKECSSSANPKVMVWGGSYAMHLVPGLLQQPELGGVIQATRSSCGPFLDIGPQRIINPEPGPVYDRAWAERCIDFNDSVFAFIRQSMSIETVVLSSPLSQYVDDKKWMHVARSDNGLELTTPTVKEAADALEKTATALRAVGKKVVLFAPPPSADFNVGGCLERQIIGRIAFGGYEGCAIPLNIYREKRSAELALLNAAEKSGVSVIRLDPFLCAEQTCKTLVDDKMIYRDAGHLSHEGSRFLATKMNWARLIEQEAR